MAQPRPNIKIHQAHGSYSESIRELGLPEGTIYLGVCSECSMITATCLHEVNDWNEEGTQLTCRLCGIDGT